MDSNLGVRGAIQAEQLAKEPLAMTAPSWYLSGAPSSWTLQDAAA